MLTKMEDRASGKNVIAREHERKIVQIVRTCQSKEKLGRSTDIAEKPEEHWLHSQKHSGQLVRQRSHIPMTKQIARSPEDTRKQARYHLWLLRKTQH